MASDRMTTMNLADDGEGMVPISQNQSTSFIKNEAQIQPEKNVSQSKETMDSTPINDIMMEPPMMTDEPKMQGMMSQMTAPQPQGMHLNRLRSPPVRTHESHRRTNDRSSCCGVHRSCGEQACPGQIGDFYPQVP